MAYEGMDFKEWIGEYPVHPVASLFPMIDDDALNALAEDIKKNGQREPIIVAYLDEAMIDEPVVIDGRNRHAACKLAGIEPEFKFVMSLNDRELSPQVIADWIISHNLHRRHLTTSQKAMVGQGYLAYLKEEAKKRQIEGGRRGAEITNSGERVSAKSREAAKGRESRSDTQAARLVGVGEKSIRDADFVAANEPSLAQEVRDGKMAVSAAAKRIREKLNPKPELTPLQKAERDITKFLKNDEDVIRLGLEIALEHLGEECPWKK